MPGVVRDDAVLVEVERLGHGRDERDLRSVGRPSRIAVGARLSDERRAGAGGDIDDRDVGGAALASVARDPVIEGDARAVRRPVEAPDHERARCERARLLRREIQHVEVGVTLILVLDLHLAPLLVARFHRVGLRIQSREGDRLAIRRPREAGHPFLGAGELLRFTAGHVDAVDLPLAIAIRDESQRPAVGRPGGLAARFGGIGQLVRLSRVGWRDPDLRFVGVVVPVRLADRVGDPLCVGRQRR